jgi:hypothetical protein
VTVRSATTCPVLIDEEDGIIAGNGRALAAHVLGLDQADQGSPHPKSTIAAPRCRHGLPEGPENAPVRPAKLSQDRERRRPRAGNQRAGRCRGANRRATGEREGGDLCRARKAVRNAEISRPLRPTVGRAGLLRRVEGLQTHLPRLGTASPFAGPTATNEWTVLFG